MAPEPIGPGLQAHRRYVWGLCYRMTGSASDADDLVQDTFVRALTRPPEDLQRPLRPWLTKVALNLSRDALRRRKVRGYVGPWLPTPVELDCEEPGSFEARLSDGSSTEGRYALMESVSFAFLVALEALTPRQRAVLLLRDVFDYSGPETAATLDMSPGNVKVVLHRARARLAAYDETRPQGWAQLPEQTQQVLGQVLAAMAQQDHATLNTLIAEQVTELSDGGGEFLAALRPVVGRDKVLRFFLNLGQRRPLESLELRTLNGLPAAVMHLKPGRPREAKRAVMICQLNPVGQIASFYTVLASPKLGHLFATGGAPP